MSSAVPREIDVRGPRFAAWVTAVVLAVALVLGSGTLVAVQAAVFAVGAFAGLRYAPYGALFRLLVAPGLGPVREREPEAPPRFAQLVGLLFAVVGASGYLLGAGPRRRRHRVRPRGGPAQRRHRFLPGLRVLPDRPAGPAGPRLTIRTPINGGMP